MEEIFDQYGESILYVVLSIIFIPMGWGLLHILSVI